MSSIFSPSMPKPTTPTALPQASDSDIQAAKLKQMAALDQSSGATGNKLSDTRLGDYSAAPSTRSGALPASQLVTAKAA